MTYYIVVNTGNTKLQEKQRLSEEEFETAVTEYGDTFTVVKFNTKGE